MSMRDLEEAAQFSHWSARMRSRFGFVVLLWWVLEAVFGGVVLASGFLAWGLAVVTSFNVDGMARVLDAFARAYLALPDGSRAEWASELTMLWWGAVVVLAAALLWARRGRGESAFSAGVREGEVA